MGVSNLITTEGETNLIVNGIFARIPVDPMTRMFKSNRPLIGGILADLGIELYQF